VKPGSPTEVRQATHDQRLRTVGGTLAGNLKRRRQAAALSHAELAELAGIAKGTVSAIESGEANPTVDTIYALAAALGCPMADLLTDAPDPMLVERPAADETVKIGALSGQLLQRFTPTGPVEVFEIRLDGSRMRRSQPHATGVYEHVWVAKGRVELGPSDAPFELGQGDYVCFAGWCEHHYKALEPPVVLLMLLSFARSVPTVPVLRHLS
jgi:transcriptional regulator with XRE-family HTH domain